MTSPKPDPVQTASDLTEAVDRLTAETQRLNTYGKRNRHLIWMLVVSLLIDVALTVAFIFSAVRIGDNSASVAGLHNASISACQLTNQNRAESKALWDYLISISKPPTTEPQRSEDLRLLAQLRAHVAQVYAPRDCQALYRLSLKESP